MCADAHARVTSGRPPRGGRPLGVAGTDPRALTRIVHATTFAPLPLRPPRPWAGATGRVLTHDGTDLRNFSVAWLAPDAGFGVIVVTNQVGETGAAAIDATAGRLIAMDQTGR